MVPIHEIHLVRFIRKGVANLCLGRSNQATDWVSLFQGTYRGEVLINFLAANPTRFLAVCIGLNQIENANLLMVSLFKRTCSCLAPLAEKASQKFCVNHVSEEWQLLQSSMIEYFLLHCLKLVALMDIGRSPHVRGGFDPLKYSSQAIHGILINTREKSVDPLVPPNPSTP